MRRPLSDDLVAQRLAELEDLCALGESLLTAHAPPIEPRVLRARSLELLGREPSGDVLDPRDVRVRVAIAGAARDVGWSADTLVDPTTGEVIATCHAILVGVETAQGGRRDRLDRGTGGVATLRFLGEVPAVIRASPLRRTWLCRAADRERTSFAPGGGRAPR